MSMEKKCCEINVRENQRGNQEWTIKRHWQDWAHKTQDEDKQITKTQLRKLKRSAKWTPPKTCGVNSGSHDW